MAYSVVFTFFFHRLWSTFLCVGFSFCQHTFPSFIPAGLYLVALRLLYGSAYPPRWLFQHQLPLVVLVLASDMECCALGPPIRKFLSFSGFFGELANPPMKDRHRIQNPNRYWNGAYFGTSLVDHRYWIWYSNDLASLHTALTTIITL